jgi:hypothetical protein
MVLPAAVWAEPACGDWIVLLVAVLAHHAPLVHVSAYGRLDSALRTIVGGLVDALLVDAGESAVD